MIDLANLAKTIRRWAKDNQIVVGPAIWHPTDGTQSRAYSLCIAVNKGRGCHLTSVHLPCGGDEADFYRLAIISALMSTKAVVIHTVDDELQMAMLCDTIWPSTKTKELLKQIEIERAAAVP